jgi:regulator of sigma D
MKPRALMTGAVRLRKGCYPLLVTTEVILAYEEKYGNAMGHQDKLKRNLSALGEVLESRFILEDQLIAGLHNRHRRLVKQAPLSA